MASAALVALPVAGAAFMELLHWYTVNRDQPQSVVRRMVRSPLHWMVTAIFVVVIPVCVFLWRRDDSATQLLLYGAAAPAILRALINAAFDAEDVLYGDEDDTKVRLRDYFKAKG
jgi:hypothetical protein